MRNQSIQQNRPPTEGELYGVFTVAGHTITVYYGYMDERDRETELIQGDNIVPVTPDFLKNPLYDENGAPLVTDIQDTCEFYAPESPEEPEEWCRDCKYFPPDKPKIGVCLCENRRCKEKTK
ncbi:MAG: hypothetical protein GX051_08120 [Clostridiales bacterium]|nr:hypothetical protein [Clostridiales bacterium]